jgi:hypothetical protein
MARNHLFVPPQFEVRDSTTIEAKVVLVLERFVPIASGH